MPSGQVSTPSQCQKDRATETSTGGEEAPAAQALGSLPGCPVACLHLHQTLFPLHRTVLEAALCLHVRVSDEEGLAYSKLKRVDCFRNYFVPRRKPLMSSRGLLLLVL